MNPQKIFTTNHEGEKLVGLVESPENQSERLPTVILVHGFAADKNDYGMFDDLAKALTEKHFLVYRFDFSGRGESEGDYSQTSLMKLTKDLRATTDFVKTQPNVDKEKIGIVGMSFGTSVAVALHAPEIRAYVLLGSVAHPYEVLKNLFIKYTFNSEGISSRKMPTGETTFMGPQLWKDLEKYNLPKMISEIQKPICFIHGEKDSIAPLSEAKTFYQNANDPKKLIIIENAGHGFDEPEERKEMVDSIEKWLSKYLA